MKGRAAAIIGKEFLEIRRSKLYIALSIVVPGSLMLIFGYPYRFDFGLFDLGMVDLVHVGKWLIYVSLVYSLASAAQYIGLFASAVEARRKQERRA